MAENYGLISNIAGGIRETMTQYQMMQNQKKQEKMMGLLQGIQETPEGDFQFTPEEKQRRDLANQLAQKQAQENIDRYNPESRSAKVMGQYAQQFGMSPVDGATAEEIEKGIGYKVKLSDMDLNRALKQAALGEKREKVAEKEFKKTPKGKIESLTGEARGKIGAFATALESLNEYEDLFNKGDRPEYLNADSPLVGGLISDTPISAVTRKISDDIGRMRSGGAINADEEKRFKNMLPRPGDNDEIARQKINSIKDEMKTRIQTYGLSTEDMARSGDFPKLQKGILTKKYDSIKSGNSKSPPPNMSFEEFKTWKAGN